MGTEHNEHRRVFPPRPITWQHPPGHANGNDSARNGKKRDAEAHSRDLRQTGRKSDTSRRCRTGLSDEPLIMARHADGAVVLEHRAKLSGGGRDCGGRPRPCSTCNIKLVEEAGPLRGRIIDTKKGVRIRQS